MIESGIEARLSTVDLKKLPGSLVCEGLTAAGQDRFLRGERRISFLRIWRPMLARDIAIKVGATVERDGFAYTDLLPA
jgi:hypothetical protein